MSPDGKVLLNHIRIESEERVPWQLEVINNGAGAGAGAVEQFKLTCGSKDTTILDKLNSIPELESMLEKSNGVMSYKNDQIVVVLNKTQLTFLTRILTEDKVAEVRKLASFRTEKQKEDFYKKLETNNAAPEKTVAPAEPAPKTVNEVAQLSKPGKNVLFKDKYKQAQSNLTLKDKPPRRHDINRSKHKPGGK